MFAVMTSPEPTMNPAAPHPPRIPRPGIRATDLPAPAPRPERPDRHVQDQDMREILRGWAGL